MGAARRNDPGAWRPVNPCPGACSRCWSRIACRSRRIGFQPVRFCSTRTGWKPILRFDRPAEARTMIPHPRRLVRRLRRLLRPVLVLVLVAAQCVTVFGYPVVIRSGETIRRCGCKVKGPTEACCCGPRACCGGVAGEPIPEPEQPACPKCKVKKTTPRPAPPAPPTLKWLPRVTARSCHGDSPLGFAAEFPSIPPAMPAAPSLTLRPIDTVSLADDAVASQRAIPPDPPPRRG